MLVEKRSGCNHMTCPICGYQWCWLCGAAYTTLHFSPLNILGCPGLQSGRNTKKKWSTTKRYFNMFGRLLIYLLLFPFALLFGCPVILVVAINEDICYLYCRDLKRKYFFLWLLLTLPLFCLALVLNFFVVIPLSPMIILVLGIMQCHSYFKQKKEIKKRYQ